MPRSFITCCQREDSNCAPQSDVKSDGTPKRATQFVRKACATMSGSAGQRNRFWPTRESVNASEKMGVAIDCGKRTNQVMGKPRGRQAEVSNWRHFVYMHFAPLAGQAGRSPLAYVSYHVGPDILGSHQSLCGTNSRM